MSREIAAFIEAAMEIGLGARLAALKADVAMAISRYPSKTDMRYLERLESQYARLMNPDLNLIGVLVRGLCEQDPTLHDSMAPAIEKLGGRLPILEKWSRQERGRRGGEAAIATDRAA
ncbi:hypothetical protein BH10PSE3_BH10PSE3_09290 [soil metagenome]